MPRESGVAGKLAAQILGHDLELGASLTASAQSPEFAFNLTLEEALAIFDLQDVAALHMTAVDLKIASKKESGARNTTWKLSCASGFKAAEVLDVQGTIEVFRQDTRTGLAFMAEPGSARLEYPLPLNAEAGDDEQVKFVFETRQFEIARDKGDDKGWGVSATSAFMIIDLPDPVQRLMPDRTDARLRIDKKGLTASLDNLLDNRTFPFPTVDLGRGDADWSDARLTIRKVAISLGKDLQCSADMVIELPPEIDNLFGVGDHGRPNFKLFNHRLDFDIAAGLKKGLSFTLNTPVFNIGEVKEDNGKSWLHLDFGQFGEVRMAPLEFSIDGATNFKANGEFERVRDLKIPMQWLKDALQGDLELLADAIPASIPLNGVNLLNDRDELDVSGFADMLAALATEAGVTPALPKTQVVRLFEDVAQPFERLPDAFREYLRFEIPSYFKFDLAVTPSTGLGIKADIRTKDDEPLKFLMPTAVGFNGVTLRHLSIGEVLSGSLIITEFDVVIDNFDMVTLASILALPVDQVALLPDSKKVHRRFVADDLLMLIVYETIIPIPIPLFFDRLGFETLGLEGLGMGMMWKFPQPRPSFVDLAAVFRDMWAFFSTKEGRLTEDVLDRHNLGLKFRIDPGYAQLPKYLGGRRSARRMSSSPSQSPHGSCSFSISSRHRRSPG
jgi:hypothetical protein